METLRPPFLKSRSLINLLMTKCLLKWTCHKIHTRAWWGPNKRICRKKPPLCDDDIVNSNGMECKTCASLVNNASVKACNSLQHSTEYFCSDSIHLDVKDSLSKETSKAEHLHRSEVTKNSSLKENFSMTNACWWCGNQTSKLFCLVPN